MTQMSAPMDTALGAPVVTIFGSVEIVLPTATIRLLDTAGVVTFDGKTFTGRDPTFGTIFKIDVLNDGVGDEAPALKMTLAPADDAAAVTLASASQQGSPVTMMLGVVDPMTGAAIGTIDVFYGAIDLPRLISGPNSRTLEMTISGAFEDFFLNDDGVRLSDTYHKFVWPGERGMSFVTYVIHQIYWGEDAPSGVTK